MTRKKKLNLENKEIFDLMLESFLIGATIDNFEALTDEESKNFVLELWEENFGDISYE